MVRLNTNQPSEEDMKKTYEFLKKKYGDQGALEKAGKTFKNLTQSIVGGASDAVLDRLHAVKEAKLKQGANPEAVVDLPYLASRFSNYLENRPLNNLSREVQKLELKNAQTAKIAALQKKRALLLAELAKYNQR